MSKGGNRNYDNEEKDGQTAKLKKRIHHLEKENTKLKSELRTYSRAFEKNITFLREKTNDISLEELIKGANAELALKDIKKEIVHKFEDLKKKWQCHICEEGVIKLIIIPNGLGGSRYFRKCSSPKCQNRTEVKTYSEDVDPGIK
jgi:ribosomal protein S20